MAIEDSNFTSASEKFEIAILPDSYIRLQGANYTIEAAAIDGFQHVPATEYHRGVEVGLIRFASEALNIKDDYYKVTVQTETEIKELGPHPAVTELRDSTNAVVHSQKSVLDVFSLELPPESERYIMVELQSVTQRQGPSRFRAVDVTLTYCCNNGTCGTCIGKGCPML